MAASPAERGACSLAGDSWKRERVMLVDGGLATELERQGHDISVGIYQHVVVFFTHAHFVPQADPLWSARLLHSDPEAILKVHKRYGGHVMHWLYKIVCSQLSREWSKYPHYSFISGESDYVW